MEIEYVSKELYERYSEIEIELGKYWADPYPNEPLVLERYEILTKALVVVDVMGFGSLRDWINCKGVKRK